MTILLSLLAPAHALDCNGLNADTCQAVNELAAAVNGEVGYTLISDTAAQTRFRTSDIYAKLDRVRSAATTTGCRDDGSFDGWAGGRYNSGSNGFFQGRGAPLGGGTTAMSGDVRRSSSSFEGTFGASSVGDEFGTFNGPGRLVGNVDSDGFLGGIWVRIGGNNGVYLALTGQCTNDVDVRAAFGNWYSGASGFAFRTDPPASYVRVDRKGMPALNTAVISSPNKNAYNAASPADDRAGTFAATDIIPNVVGLHAALDDDLLGLGLIPCSILGGSCVAQAAPLVLPDTLQVDGSGTSSFPNGRHLADPVIDLTLAVVLLELSVHPVTLFADLPLNPPANDVAFYGDFPYLAGPH